MKINPPKKNISNESLEKLRKEFIESDSLGVEAIKKAKAIKYPWESDSVSSKRSVNYPLRVSEVIHSKMKHISDKTGVPMSTMIKTIVEPWVNKKILELLKDMK